MTKIAVKQRPAPVVPENQFEHDAMAGLKAITRLARETSAMRGWDRNAKTGRKIKRNFGEGVALIHSEVSEALEAYRRDAMDDKLPHRKGVEVEFADAIIRLCDWAAELKLDLAGAVIEKNRFNRVRKDHSVAARTKKGGKKF